jgi:hypothetical protein
MSQELLLRCKLDFAAALRSTGNAFIEAAQKIEDECNNAEFDQFVDTAIGMSGGDTQPDETDIPAALDMVRGKDLEWYLDEKTGELRAENTDYRIVAIEEQTTTMPLFYVWFGNRIKDGTFTLDEAKRFCQANYDMPF